MVHRLAKTKVMILRTKTIFWKRFFLNNQNKLKAFQTAFVGKNRHILFKNTY